jgi:lysophospholipase L1-like esterase
MDPDMIVVYHGFNDLVPRVFDGFAQDYFHFRRVAPVSESAPSRSYLVRLALKAWSESENSNLLTYIWKRENLPDDTKKRVDNFERTSPSAFEDNLEHIIRISESYGIQVVLATFAIDCETQHWTDAVPAELWDKGIAQHNEIVKRLATTHGLPLVEFAEFAKTEEGMFSDSIHMTVSGNHRKAECFAKTIRPIVAGMY